MEFLIDNWIFGLGFFAQSLFGARVLVQWIKAEQKQKVVSPVLFWKFSLAGSFLFLIYGVLRNDIVIILGQIVAYYIYVRNLQLKNEWNKFGPLIRLLLLMFPPITVAIIFYLQPDTSSIFSTSWDGLVWLGIAGQLLLNLRFVYQLYYSEQRKQSILPSGFWWISLTGSILVCVYAINRHDPVLIVAQTLALVPYVRNIMLSRRKRELVE